MARTTTVFGASPPMMKPAIITLSSVSTRPRVEMLVRRESAWTLGGEANSAPRMRAQMSTYVLMKPSLTVKLFTTFTLHQ